MDRAEPAQPRLRTEGLTAWYGPVAGVRDVTSTFAPNQVHALIGPSGCGKSTFLRSLNRLHEETPGGRVTGRVLLDGEDVYASKVDLRRLRRKVGMVFQRPTPFPTMSVYDNVAAGLRLDGRVARRTLDGQVERALSHAALWDEVKDRLHTSAVALSGGQQQRLCIARTIAPAPEVVLLDEPTASLDPQGTHPSDVHRATPAAHRGVHHGAIRMTAPVSVSQESRVAGAIDVRGFSFSYGSQSVLQDVSFSIPRRAVTAIIGPSGCGKSTFLRSINRLNDLIPESRHGGDILVDRRSIYGPGVDLVALRQRVGMVFQRPNPFPKTIYDNVVYGPKLNGLVPARDLPGLAERCLRQAALWDEVKDRLDTPATGLSGGQQQRLCIARALGNDPDVLLMDEPCSALDPIATSRVEELIVQLKAKYTIVIVTHNMQQAARVSDVTGFFYKGELVEFGPTERIFTAPSRERTEAYITGRFG